MDPMNLLSNVPLWAALLTIVIAQSIKIPIYRIATGQWNWKLLFSTGGMPSSHSAAVVSMTTTIGFIEGWDSSLFAISAVFSAIIMFDAAGVRRHAGEHAVVLNHILQDLHNTFREVQWNHPYQDEKLKELLGHKPTEVIAGATLGFVTGLLCWQLSLYSAPALTP